MLAAITKCYCEPHRHYHVLTHPASMIEIGMQNFSLTDEQILAIWYHDAVYEAGSNMNEIRSAALFFDHFSNSDLLSPESLREVEEIIIDTREHIPTLESSKAVIDLDLMGLGGTYNEYWRSAKNVRQEYSAFSDEEWKVGRTKFLDRMLAKKQIFYTEQFSLLERSARHNMEYERNLLAVGNPRYK